MKNIILEFENSALNRQIITSLTFLRDFFANRLTFCSTIHSPKILPARFEFGKLFAVPLCFLPVCLDLFFLRYPVTYKLYFLSLSWQIVNRNDHRRTRSEYFNRRTHSTLPSFFEIGLNIRRSFKRAPPSRDSRGFACVNWRYRARPARDTLRKWAVDFSLRDRALSERLHANRARCAPLVYFVCRLSRAARALTDASLSPGRFACTAQHLKL